MLISFIGTWLNNMFHKILLLIDGCIYWAVSQVYQIFIKLADARIFQDAFFSNFAKRIYAIIGVVMLFYLAYALLTSLVDPDKATSGDKSLTKLAQNIVISLVMLGFLPTIFDYAYKIQGIIFKENVIGAIIFGTGSTDSNSISEYGNYMAYTAINPFLNPGNYNVRLADNYSWFDLKAELIEDGMFTLLPILSDWAIEDQKTISESWEPDADNDGEPEIVAEGKTVSLGYKPILSTACGVALLYIIFSFCLDLGIRIVKFAFCQLIAPIPVVLRMIPGKKGTFDKWLKLTLTVYFEVFIRVGIMYLVIYFFSEIANMDMFKYATSGIQGLVVLVIILLGLLAFAKQAPKMLSDMLGLDSGNIKLGIKDKLKASGFLGNAIVNGAGKVRGAVTGSLGGGIAGLANGARAAGFAFGLANGWKNSGAQFGKQKQNLYSTLTGDYKGKAGLFGRQSWGTKIYNRLTGTAKLNAAKNNEEQMKRFEDPIIDERENEARRRYNQMVREATNKFRTEQAEFEDKKIDKLIELNENLNKLTSELKNNMKEFNDNKIQQLSELESKINQKRNEFEAEKNSKLQQKNMELSYARDNNDVIAENRLQKEISALNQTTFDNTDLAISLKNEFNRIDSNTFDDSEMQKNISKIRQQIESIQNEEYHNDDLEEVMNSRFSFDRKAVRQSIRDEYKNHEYDKASIEARRNYTSEEKKYHHQAQVNKAVGNAKADASFKSNFEKMMKEYNISGNNSEKKK